MTYSPLGHSLSSTEKNDINIFEKYFFFRLAVLADHLHLRVSDVPLHVLRLLLARGTPPAQQDGGEPGDPEHLGGGREGGGHHGLEQRKEQRFAIVSFRSTLHLPKYFYQ